MKYSGFLLIVSYLLFVTSCEKDTVENVECKLLSIALIDKNHENLKVEIDKLTIDLKPHVNDNDRYGHRENINTLVEMLNSQCDNIEASLFCYACIETLPPQSEILIVVDSAGTEVCRIIDILTPEDEVLSFYAIHDCYY